MEKYTRRRISERGCKGDGEHEKKINNTREKSARAHTPKRMGCWHTKGMSRNGAAREKF